METNKLFGELDTITPEKLEELEAALKEKYEQTAAPQDKTA